MKTQIQKINFSTLSKGEQTKVYEIFQKVRASQPIDEKEKQFISDMAARGELSKPDALNKAWAAMVSRYGAKAGDYAWSTLESTLIESREWQDAQVLNLLLLAFSKAIEPLGGSISRAEIKLNSEGSIITKGN